MAITSTFLLMIHPLLLLLPNAAGSSAAAQFLALHNKLRQRLGLPPLQWSDALARVARGYANQRRADCAMVHSAMDYGENLFWGQGKSWQPGDAVASWAAEARNYDYGRNACLGGVDCYHYTQMVWRTTKPVGCAEIYCGGGDTYIVCEYDPHGNTIGQRPY